MRILFAFLLVACSSRGDGDRDPGPGGQEIVGSAGPATPAAGTPLQPVTGTDLVAPGITVAGDQLLLSYIGAAPGGKPGKAVMLARLNGNTWGAPRPITISTELFANWADTPSVVGLADGSLLAHWLQKSAASTYAYDVRMARSIDGGASWQPLGSPHDDGTPTEHGFVSLLPVDGAALAIWLDGRNMAARPPGAMTLRAAGVAAGKFAAGPVLDERVCDCCGTAAALAPAGPVVLYRDRSDTEVRDISVVRRVEGSWSEPRPVHADGWTIDGCPVNGPALAADGGALFAAWFTMAGDRPRVLAATSADGGARFSAPVEIDAQTGKRAPLGRVGAVAAGAGAGVVSWMSAEGSKAWILLRRVRAGAAGPVIQVAETRAGRDAGFPRMVRRGDDLAIVWLDVGPPATIQGRLVPLASVP